MENRVLIVFIFFTLKVFAQNIDSTGYIDFRAMKVKHSVELVNNELNYKLDTISSIGDSIKVNCKLPFFRTVLN